MASLHPKLALNENCYTIVPVTPSLPPSTLTTILSGIVFLHADCILTDHTMATFLPPLHYPLMLHWWQARLGEATNGGRIIWVVLASTSSRTTGSPQGKGKAAQAFSDIPFPTTSISGKATEVAGVVSLSRPHSQTGPFRGHVEKLFVSPFHRRRGFARVLMAALEDRAWKLGCWNLMLDTVKDSEAESVYPRLGYKMGMVVERYGYSPKDGKEMDEVMFWKDLRWERGEGVRHRNGRDGEVFEMVL